MTTPHQSSVGVIEDLQARLAVLPLRRRSSKRVGALKQHLALVTASAQAMTDIQQVRSFIKEVFPDAAVDTSDKAIASARIRAQSLLTVLTTPDAIEDVSVEPALGELKRAVQSAHAGLKAEWRKQVEAATSGHERLVGALHSAGLPGSQRLAASVERVRRMSDPPRTESEATRVAQDLRALNTGVKDLGLEGVVGEFLTAAADRRGSARALLHPDVAAFLEAHDFWDVLTVSLPGR